MNVSFEDLLTSLATDLESTSIQQHLLPVLMVKGIEEEDWKAEGFLKAHYLLGLNVLYSCSVLSCLYQQLRLS